MGHQQDKQHSDPVVAAIERVLKTEHEGVEHATAGRCGTPAERNAGAGGRACAAPTPAFRNCTRPICKKSNATSKHSAAPCGAARADKAYDPAVLAAAAQRVAAKLTGGA